MASLRNMGSGMSLRNNPHRRQPEIRIKEVKMKPHLSGVEREELHQQRLKDAKADRTIANAYRQETAKRAAESGVVDYKAVGDEYIKRFAKAELENQWKSQEQKFMSDSGRVIVEVKNSLQFELRQIESKLDRITKKYAKKRTGNQHIAQGLTKLQATLTDIIEKALRELLRYMIDEEHKQNAELIPFVVECIRKSEEDIGYRLNQRQANALVHNAVTMMIQQSTSDRRLENYVYDQVDMYSRTRQ